MEYSIQIIEKPDWVSWDEIHEVLWESHAENREKDIINSFPSLSGDELRKFVGDKGKMFVAMDGKKVVGTAAVLIINNKRWYSQGDYAYVCLGAVLPEYRQRRAYFLLEKATEVYSKSLCSEFNL